MCRTLALLLGVLATRTQARNTDECSLTLKTGDFSYTITKTEINIEQFATSATKQGPCCYRVYSHPSKKKGASQLITEHETELHINIVGSAFISACSENGGNILMYSLVGVVGFVLILMTLCACKLSAGIQFSSLCCPRRRQRHRLDNMNLPNGSTDKFLPPDLEEK